VKSAKMGQKGKKCSCGGVGGHPSSQQSRRQKGKERLPHANSPISGQRRQSTQKGKDENRNLMNREEGTLLRELREKVVSHGEKGREGRGLCSSRCKHHHASREEERRAFRKKGGKTILFFGKGSWRPWWGERIKSLRCSAKEDSFVQ